MKVKQSREIKWENDIVDVITWYKEKGSNQGIKVNEHRHIKTPYRRHSKSKRFDSNLYRD